MTAHRPPHAPVPVLSSSSLTSSRPLSSSSSSSSHQLAFAHGPPHPLGLSTPSSSRPMTPLIQSSTTTHKEDPNTASSRRLISTLSANDDESLLCLCVQESINGEGGDGKVYAGSQSGSIHVWSLSTLSLRARLTGHTGAVLALECVQDRGWLISSSGDGTIRIWHTPTLTPLFLIHPPHDNVGDLFSLAYLPRESIEEDPKYRSDDDDVDEDGIDARGWEGLSKEASFGSGRGPSKERDIPSDQADARGKTGVRGFGSGSGGRLFVGCQDTSIQVSIAQFSTCRDLADSRFSNLQWIDLPSLPLHSPNDASSSTPTALPSYLSSSYPGSSSPPIHRAPNKFFDAHDLKSRAIPKPGSTTPTGSGRNSNLLDANGEHSDKKAGGGRMGAMGGTSDGAIELQVDEACIATFAHYGYVYCMLKSKSNDRPVLISGSGDSTIRLWSPTQSSLQLLTTLSTPTSPALSLESEAILSLSTHPSQPTLFAGHQAGLITIWDLDTFQSLRILQPHTWDVLSLSCVNSGELYAGDSGGGIGRWDKGFGFVERWQVGVEGRGKAGSAVLAMAVAAKTQRKGGKMLLTGGNDNLLRVWSLPDPPDLTREQEAAKSQKGFQGELFLLLSRLISYKSISSLASHREECRQTALYLKRVLRSFGASGVQVIPNGIEGKNPFVYGKFVANAPAGVEGQKKRKRVLFYGHYDVVAADEGWSQDPWELTGKNGWLYGRGVTDNKGPILAIASAASSLQLSQCLPVDLVMILEGEEETGSAGFQDAIRRHRALIGEIDVILVSNSYWIGEDVPCVTFGLRGVIHASLKVTSNQPDLHSGISGGVVSEPLVDLVRVLSSLTSSTGQILIPNFLTSVRPLVPSEDALYESIIQRCSPELLLKGSHQEDPKKSLIDRWRQPSLSIHAITTSSPSKALIPSSAESKLSIRIVPDQSLDEVIESLKLHLRKAFDELRTVNQLQIEINHTSTFWLSSPHSPANTLLASCIHSAWGIEPLFIREGGSIPSLPFLEAEFGADAVHFPMATGEANAHLGDERIRFENLEKGREIVGEWLRRLGDD